MRVIETETTSPTHAPPRPGRTRLLLWGGLVAVAALAITEVLVLAPPPRSRDTTYDFSPIPDKWTFPTEPEGRTQNAILTAYQEGWGSGARRPGAEEAPADAWKARMTALRDLARLGPDAVPVLLEGLDDANPEIRNLAAQAMGYFGGPEQADRLERAMAEDPDGTVRIYAGMSRAMIGGPIPQSLLELIGKFDPLRMAKSRLELAMKRGPEPPSDAIRETLAGFDLDRMDTARVGSPAPDFTLTDQAGNRVHLGDFRGKNDVVLVFIYGVNCMFCTGQIGRLHHTMAEFEADGARILVVESSEPYRIQETLQVANQDPEDNSVALLSDPSHTVAACYGVAMQMNHVEWLNRPSTFLIDREGIIRYVYLGDGPADRPSTGDLVAELQKIHEYPDSLTTQTSTLSTSAPVHQHLLETPIRP